MANHTLQFRSPHAIDLLQRSNHLSRQALGRFALAQVHFDFQKHVHSFHHPDDRICLSISAMDRRHFFQLSAASAAAPVMMNAAPTPHSYHLRYAPSMNMGGWAGKTLTPEQQLEKYAEWGFSAFEYNGLPSRTNAQIESLRKKRDEVKLAMGVFVVNSGGWKESALVDKIYHEKFLRDVKRAKEIHSIMEIETATITTGLAVPNLSFDEQTKNCIEGMKRAADIVAGTKMVLVLEPLNIRVDHMGYFCVNSDHGAHMIREVNSPNVKLLFDMYHQQISEGDLIHHINDNWDAIGYFQVGDVPGRKEPETGEVNWRNVFKAIHAKGYKGILGMEHGLSVSGEDGLKKCFEAYRRADTWDA